MIRVDYLVRVISLLLLIGILTSCVPEEDAVESSSSGGASLGDAQILWGHSTSSEVTFSTPFTEKPQVLITRTSSSCSSVVSRDNTTTTKFEVNNCNGFSWQAIGKYK